MVIRNPRIDDRHDRALAIHTGRMQLIDTRGIVHGVIGRRGVIGEGLQVNRRREGDRLHGPDLGDAGQLGQVVDGVAIRLDAGAREDVAVEGLDDLDARLGGGAEAGGVLGFVSVFSLLLAKA